jgi:epoxyqueuosine reductase
LQTRFLEQARKAGFELAGFTRARVPEKDRLNLQAFAQTNESNDLSWFASHLHLRLNPSEILPGAISVLMLGTVYRHTDADNALENATARISRYAMGKDYHLVLRKKAARLADEFYAENSEQLSHLRYRVTTDSAPVPEKVLAREAGLGWQGKNTNLIHPELGSYFFLTAIFLNAELEMPPERPAETQDSLFRPANFDRCGSCRQCIDACPTGALEPYRIEAGLCLSYWTIEAKQDMPTDISRRAGGWVFGCDICQEVCPYNRGPGARRQVTAEPAFVPRPALLEWMRNPVRPNEEAWRKLSVSSPLKRAGLDRFRSSMERSL